MNKLALFKYSSLIERLELKTSNWLRPASGPFLFSCSCCFWQWRAPWREARKFTRYLVMHKWWTWQVCCEDMSTLLTAAGAREKRHLKERMWGFQFKWAVNILCQCETSLVSPYCPLVSVVHRHTFSLNSCVPTCSNEDGTSISRCYSVMKMKVGKTHKCLRKWISECSGSQVKREG